MNWYDVPTGGSTLYVGSPFTTPTISTSTNFYVSASIQGSTVAGGKPSTTGPDGGYTGTDAGVVFDANVPFKIISVLMYPQGASQVTIEARTSAGALIPGCQWTENFTGATSTGVVVPINFSIPVGVSHRLIVSGNNTSTPIWRDFSPNAFPYTLGAVGSITSGYITGVSSAYYFFYDWKVADVCEGSRTTVLAPVSNPPAFTSVTPLPAGQTICGGGSVTLNATSATPGTFTWNPCGIPNGLVVSPSVTTTYTVTGLFPGSCRRDSAITITVNPTPTNLVVSPATATICVPTIVPLTATGGILVGQTIVNERFETFPLTQFGVTGSGVTVAPNTTYYQQGIQSGHLTHGNSIDGQLALTTGINLSQIQNPTLSFNQIVALEQCCDSACVQFSTNGGASWSSFPASAYIGSASLLNSAVDFNSGSYSDWNTQFTDAADEPGIGPATSLWKKRNDQPVSIYCKYQF